MIMVLLLILTLIVAPVVIFTLAMCRTAALADRKMEILLSGNVSAYSIKSKRIESEIPTVPIRSSLHSKLNNSS